MQYPTCNGMSICLDLKMKEKHFKSQISNPRLHPLQLSNHLNLEIKHTNPSKKQELELGSVINSTRNLRRRVRVRDLPQLEKKEGNPVRGEEKEEKDLLVVIDFFK